MIQNLNKENFRNELKNQCPNAMEQFCRWIDEYKFSIKWVFLFSGDEIKFHDIPYEMQIGIVFKFLAEQSPHTWWTVEITQRKNTVNYIKSAFWRFESQLTTAKL